jgi:hypothetical protein
MSWGRKKKFQKFHTFQAKYFGFELSTSLKNDTSKQHLMDIRV